MPVTAADTCVYGALLPGRPTGRKDLACRLPGDQTGKPERTSTIQAKHLRLTGKVGATLLTELLAQLIPLEPELPAIWQHVRRFNLQQPGLFPVAVPPAGRMKAAEVPDPVLRQMWRR